MEQKIFILPDLIAFFYNGKRVSSRLLVETSYSDGFYMLYVSKFISANKNTKQIHKGTKLKKKIQSGLTKKLVYNYCQCWERFKSQIIISKSYMAYITQNKQMPKFIENSNKKNKKGVSKSFTDSKTAYWW